MAVGWLCHGCRIVRGEKWTGPCRGCGRWFDCKRTIVEGEGQSGLPSRGEVVPLGGVAASSQERISTGYPGIDRVLGFDPITGDTGIAQKAGQAIQIFGSPGCGKSTLLLQMYERLTRQRITVLYIVGEESLEQMKARADRLNIKFNVRMLVIDEQDLDAIINAIDEHQPLVVVIDSINTVSVEDYMAGSTAAIKIAATEIYRFTKARGIALILVTQMDKAGEDFSGPKALEHIVDTSLFMNVLRDGTRKLECAAKNRFGRVPAHQRLDMTEKEGLVEIDDEEDEEEKTPLQIAAAKALVELEKETPPNPPPLTLVP